MNIHEDLQRDDVETPAKPVLFGNGNRLISPADRGPQFTDKCILAAKSSGTALVPTSELFTVVKYADEVGSDTEFVANCRKAILGGSGMVQFPPIPEIEGEEPAVETTVGK